MSDAYKDQDGEVENCHAEGGPRKAYKQNKSIPEQEDQDISSVIEERLSENSPEGADQYD